MKQTMEGEGKGGDTQITWQVSSNHQHSIMNILSQ